MKTKETSGKKVSKKEDTVDKFYRKGLGKESLRSPLNANLNEPLYK
jgi:hypothetical protein